MNTFDQLPKDLINKIVYINSLPEIDIERLFLCQSYQDLYFKFRYQLISVKNNNVIRTISQ